jgi:hypothetical protein
MDGDPSRAELAREFPGWHIWRGVNGLWYARRPGTSPPVVLKDENTAELRAQIRARNGGSGHLVPDELKPPAGRA